MKKLLKITLALMMALGLQLTSLNAVDALNIDLSKVGTYQIPIKSLTSSAPMPVVKKAFANAFGDTLEVTVDKDGKMQAVATLQNMIINMESEYYANVLTIANGTTLSTKVEKSTQGMGGETLEVEVPEKISFELPQLDENNSTVLSITVDFMNYFMGQGKDYPTNVTLTLDLDNAKELQKEYVLEDGTYDVPVNVLKENSDDQSMAAQAVESAQIIVQNNEVVVTLKLKEMTMYGQTASVDKMEYQLKDGTYKEATVIEEEDGHPKKVQFKLDENKELTNVKFYYGGSPRGAIARLQLKLDGLTKVDPTPETPKDDEDKKDEENTSRFTKDGTYSVDVAYGMLQVIKNQWQLLLSIQNQKLLLKMEKQQCIFQQKKCHLEVLKQVYKNSILEVNKKIIKIMVLQSLKKMYKGIQHYGPLNYLMKMNISM